MLNDEERNSIVDYKVEKALTVFAEAKIVFEQKLWNLTGNRLYYSVYHITTALLLANGMPTKTHAGVMHLFGEHFVRTGKVDKSYGRLYASLFALRQSGDYDDKYDSTREDVEPYFVKVEEYINALRNLID